MTRSIAALLGLCVAVLAGWILFVDDPFGGEPMAVVSAHADPQRGQARSAARKPRGRARRARRSRQAGGSKTVTIIDGSTGKRQEVIVGRPGAAPAAEKKSEVKTDAG